MWKEQLSNVIHIAWQVHISTFPLQYILAMPDDQFIFSSSWLLSPRIRTTDPGWLQNVYSEFTGLECIKVKEKYVGKRR